MLKKVVQRTLLGFPQGVAIGFGITIWISAIIGDGAYHPAIASLVQACGSEIGAVFLQFILTGLIGAAFAGSSAIFETEWSILKQTIIHCIIVSATFLPIAYFTHWMEHTAVGIITYFAIFFGLYIVIWIMQYFIWKKKIRQMNNKIKEVNK